MTPQKFTKLFDQMEVAERDMLRARVRRANKALDAEFTKRANALGGKADWRDFGDKV